MEAWQAAIAAADAAEAAERAWNSIDEDATRDGAADAMTERAARAAWQTSLTSAAALSKAAEDATERAVAAELAEKQMIDDDMTRDDAPDAGPGGAKGLMQNIKDAGVAGAISYAGWELAFWAASVPVCLAAYYGVAGEFPDLTNMEDRAKLGAEAFAFVNVARFAVPLRIGLALSTVPWVQANVVDRFQLNPTDAPAPPMAPSVAGYRSATDIFMAGLNNVAASPTGWFYGLPSPLYSNSKTPPTPPR